MIRKIIVPILAIGMLAVSAFAQADGYWPSPEESRHFYNATLMTAALYQKGDMAGAKTSAEALLVEAERYPKDWNYGNAVRTGHLVIGLVALGSGDKREAGKQLLAAGRTPGSPSLISFGPNMLLAQKLLEQKETDVVLEYMTLCEKFWEPKFSRVAVWRAAIKGSEMPEFGANLRYHL